MKSHLHPSPLRRRNCIWTYFRRPDHEDSTFLRNLGSHPRTTRCHLPLRPSFDITSCCYDGVWFCLFVNSIRTIKWTVWHVFAHFIILLLCCLALHVLTFAAIFSDIVSRILKIIIFFCNFVPCKVLQCCVSSLVNVVLLVLWHMDLLSCKLMYVVKFILITVIFKCYFA
jgi:hypothetical protein